MPAPAPEKRYRKKPVVITAYQTDREMVIPTLEGDHKASPGDYIITGIKGEKYPCKADIFAATYEAVDDAPAPSPAATVTIEAHACTNPCCTKQGARVVSTIAPSPEKDSRNSDHKGNGNSDYPAPEKYHYPPLTKVREGVEASRRPAPAPAECPEPPCHHVDGPPSEWRWCWSTPRGQKACPALVAYWMREAAALRERARAAESYLAGDTERALLVRAEAAEAERDRLRDIISELVRTNDLPITADKTRYANANSDAVTRAWIAARAALKVNTPAAGCPQCGHEDHDGACCDCVRQYCAKCGRDPHNGPCHPKSAAGRGGRK